MAGRGTRKARKPKNQPPAVAYCRVSTAEQAAEGVSLPAQRARLAAYCESRGLSLVAVHSDEGISGSKTSNRPGLQAALEQACELKAPLVVYSLSRLARSTRDAILLAERLDASGAGLVSLTEQIDTQSPMGRYFYSNIAAIGQLERDLIAERTRSALQHKRQKGEKTGGLAPFGFDATADGRLVENPGEQEALAYLRRARSRGTGYLRLARALERRGIPTKSGRSKWHPQVVKQILDRDKAA